MAYTSGIRSAGVWQSHLGLAEMGFFIHDLQTECARGDIP